MALGDVIARLSVSLGLETAAFEKGSRKAQREVHGLSQQMSRASKAIGGALAGMVSWELVRNWSQATKAALDFAGGLGETAQQLGVTTTELQEFRFIASQTGIEQAQMDKALQKTTRTLGELATPTKAQAEAMKELGLSAKELEGINTAEFLVLLADKFKGLTAAEQAATGAQLGLGKSFQTLIPMLNEGSAGIQKMREEAHKLGIVISEQAIENSDKNADLLSTYEQIKEAQKNVTLTQPENVRAYMEYSRAVTTLEVGFYKATTQIINFGDAWDQTVRDFGKNTGIQDFFKNFNTTVSEWARITHDAIASVPVVVGFMVDKIKGYIGGALNAVWDNAISKIKTVGAMFDWLYDVVVGNSYVPDMVDEIGVHMARLDQVMVAQAGKATSATGKKFQELRDLLDSLFPEVGKANQFDADLAAIEASGLSQAAQDAAVERLWRRTLSGSPFRTGGTGEPDFGDSGPLVKGMGETGDAIERLTERSKKGTVAIAETFKDMADKTLQSLGRLTSAIRGGDFLGILEGVIGLGLQLGSMGAFGSNIAGKLNSVSKIPKWANGTNFHPGGLALVGERGPELVSMPRGSRVTPNHALGGGNTYYISGNLLTPEFWAQIQNGDIQAAQGGAMLARAQGARSGKWSLAA